MIQALVVQYSYINIIGVSSVTSGQSSKRSSRINSGIHPLEQNNKSTKNIEETSSNKETRDLTNPSMTHLNNGSSHASSTTNVTATSTFDNQVQFSLYY